jgi:hypothetical protein
MRYCAMQRVPTIPRSRSRCSRFRSSSWSGREAGEGGEGGVLPGILSPGDALAAILRDHDALAGNKTFALSNALIAAEAIDVARLPEMVAWCRLPDALAAGMTLPARALSPAPMAYPAGHEAVHLRFIAGVAIAKPGVDLTADVRVGKWGVPFARALTAQLAPAGASLLALPRAPRRLLPAVAEGRAAWRDVAAQIYASNTLRKFRSAGRRANGRHQRASRARRAGRRRAAALVVFTVRRQGCRGFPLSAVCARARERRRRRCSLPCLAIAG